LRATAAARRRRLAGALDLTTTLATTLTAALTLTGSAAACTLPASAGVALSGADVQLAWQAVPAPIAVSRPFQLVVTICPANSRLSRVDATMPEHRHGMNYRPSLRPLEGGRWAVEGMLWHMAGRWELRFDVEADGRVQTLRHSLVLQ
jgi:hypothetical protein